MNPSDFILPDETTKLECSFYGLRRKVEVRIGVSDSRAYLFEKAANYEYFTTTHGIASASCENFIVQWWEWLIAVILIPVIIGLVLLILFIIRSNRYNVFFMIGGQRSPWGTISGRYYQVRKKSNDFVSIQNFIKNAF